MGDQIILGNVSPVNVVRNGTAEMVFNAVAECHRQAGPRFIVGAGCEIPRDTPPENVRAFLAGLEAKSDACRGCRDAVLIEWADEALAQLDEMIEQRRLRGVDIVLAQQSVIAHRVLLTLAAGRP